MLTDILTDSECRRWYDNLDGVEDGDEDMRNFAHDQRRMLDTIFSLRKELTESHREIERLRNRLYDLCGMIDIIGMVIRRVIEAHVPSAVHAKGSALGNLNTLDETTHQIRVYLDQKGAPNGPQ